MSKESEKEILQSQTADMAKNLKTEKDLSALNRELVKLTIETALGKEMDNASSELETGYESFSH